MLQCPSCRRPGVSWLCSTCTRHLDGSMRQCAMLVGQLEVTLTRQDDVMPESVGTSGSNNEPIPFSTQASECLDTIRDSLRPWAVRVGLSIDQDLTRKLCGNVLRLARFDDVADLIDLLDALCKQAMRIVDRQEVRLYLGECDECGRALVGEDGVEFVECACEKRWRVDDLRQVNRDRGRDLWVTATDAEKYLGEVYGLIVTRQRIGMWHKRNKIDRRDGRYRVGDIIDLLKSRPGVDTNVVR